MKEYGSYVAARTLRGGRVSTLRGVDRLTGMPVLLYTLPTPAPLPSLDHPRLLSYTDFGTAHDTHFVVVALPPAASRVTDPLVAARGALSALAHLHERGLVHGGVTPEQLWLVDGDAALAGASLPWGGLDGGFDAPEGGKSAAVDLFALGRTLDALGARPAALAHLTDPDPARRGTAREALQRLNAPAPLQREPAQAGRRPELTPLMIDDTFVDASRMTPPGAPAVAPPDETVPSPDMAEGVRVVAAGRARKAEREPSSPVVTPVPGDAPAPASAPQVERAADADSEESTSEAGADVDALPRHDGGNAVDAGGKDDRSTAVQPEEPLAHEAPKMPGAPDDPHVTVITVDGLADATRPSQDSVAADERPGAYAPLTADAPVVPAQPVPPESHTEAHGDVPSLRHQPIRIGWEEDHSWRVVKSGAEPARPAEPARRPTMNPLALAAVALVILIVVVLLLRGAQTAPAVAACCDVRFTVSGDRGVTARLTVESAPTGTSFRPGDELTVAPGEVTLPDVPGTYRLRVLADGFEPGSLEIRVPQDRLVQIELGR